MSLYTFYYDFIQCHETSAPRDMFGAEKLPSILEKA
jgi:hypothetical protein